MAVDVGEMQRRLDQRRAESETEEAIPQVGEVLIDGEMFKLSRTPLSLPTRSCSNCGNKRGFETSEQADPSDPDGRLYGYIMPPCQCIVEANSLIEEEKRARDLESRIGHCWATCGLDGEYRRMQFDKHEWDAGQRPMLARAYRALVDPSESTLVIGHNGCGKSDVAACLVRALCDKGISAVFCTWPDFENDIKLGNPDMNQYIDRLCRCRFLVWDDFCRSDRNELTDWTLKKITEIVAARESRRLPIWMTMNWEVTGKVQRLIGNNNLSRLRGMFGAARIEVPADVPDYRTKDAPPWWAE